MPCTSISLANNVDFSAHTVAVIATKSIGNFLGQSSRVCDWNLAVADYAAAWRLDGAG